jgi:hypothetical protein
MAVTFASSVSVVPFDFKTHHWSELAKPSAAYSELVEGRSVCLLSALARKVERVADLKNFRMAGFLGLCLGLAPDDSLGTRDPALGATRL